MKPLLPLALLLIAPLPRLAARGETHDGLQDVCDACRRGRLCRPHAKFEAAEIERLRPDLESDEIRDRIGALREIAALTREHQNVPTREVATILVAALEDRSLRVRDRAIRLLTDGQQPEITVVALVGLLEGFRKNMWSLVPWLTGPREERGTTADAMNYLETVMRVSGDVPDDRVVKALADVLLAMPAEMRGQPVAMAATRSLLGLGTRDAVQAVLRQFSSWSEGREMRNIHDALRYFALDLDVEDFPEYGGEAPEQWARWFKKHARDLPSKLGKWRGKPLEGDEDERPAPLAQWSRRFDTPRAVRLRSRGERSSCTQS